MTTLTGLLVGIGFHPPAKALVPMLPSATPLILERDPTNEYDSNAVKVLISVEHLTEQMWEDLSMFLPGWGLDRDEIMSDGSIWLGFIGAKKIPPEYQVADDFAKAIDALTEPDNTGSVEDGVTLSFSASGKPLVSWSFS